MPPGAPRGGYKDDRGERLPVAHPPPAPALRTLHLNRRYDSPEQHLQLVRHQPLNQVRHTRFNERSRHKKRGLRARGDEQVTVLLARDPAAHAALDDPDAVADLLSHLHLSGKLRVAGAHEQFTALAKRAAAYAALDNPRAVAGLSAALQVAGAHEQVTALARRAAAYAVLDNPHTVAGLSARLRVAGAHEQVTAHAARLARNGLFAKYGGHWGLFRFGREPDGSAASSWAWNDLD
ncbi:hypothetical protein ACLQ2D_28795 [Streptomyces sp. DT199]|uniref:hypothetical protein n=1 Tax=Streptomyces TaxID=1883 RepID=UPI003719D066